MVAVGFLEGVAEATAAITKIFSGALSDYLGKRKLLVVLGYGLGAITKPVFPLAPSVTWVFAARFTERIGKGIRGTPRDALVADITPPELRGAAYGLRQSLDSVGAFLGPLLAIVFMALWTNDIKAVLWVAVLPAFISVALVLSIREPEVQEKQPAMVRPSRSRPPKAWIHTTGSSWLSVPYLRWRGSVKLF
jgi:MFS family permease